MTAGGEVVIKSKASPLTPIPSLSIKNNGRTSLACKDILAKNLEDMEITICKNLPSAIPYQVVPQVCQHNQWWV